MTVVIPAKVISCAVCAHDGPWWATAHCTRPLGRVQLFKSGAAMWPPPAPVAVPVCSAECANEMVLAYGCPVYDKHGVELHGWLAKWRVAKQAEAAKDGWEAYERF